MAVAEIMRLSLQPTEARLASRERPDHVKIGRVKGLEMEHIHRVLCQQLPVGAHRIFLDTADQHHPLLRLIHDERSEEHTSELQSLMRISYAVFCLKKKTKYTKIQTTIKQ